MTSDAPLRDPAENPELLGHEDAVRTLEQALASGRLHHGWLFHGRRGIGKATLAYRFARVLLRGEASRSGLHVDAADPVFTQVAGRHHPDLAVIEQERDQKTGKLKSEIPVDKVREAASKLHSTSAIAERRVLILISHRPGQVTATLRSRCAKLPLQGLNDATLIELLAKHAPDLAAEARTPIVSMASGSIGRALELADGAWLETYEKVLKTLAAEPLDALAIEDLASALSKWSAKEGFPAVIDLIQTVFGRIIAEATGRSGSPLFAGEEKNLSSLGSRQTLDRWAGLWEKIGRLSAAVDGVNLDHTQALAQILSAMARPPKEALPFTRPTSSFGGDLLGASPF